MCGTPQRSKRISTGWGSVGSSVSEFAGARTPQPETTTQAIANNIRRIVPRASSTLLCPGSFIEKPDPDREPREEPGGAPHPAPLERKNAIRRTALHQSDIVRQRSRHVRFLPHKRDVLDRQRPARRQPSIYRRAEKRAALHHRTPAFGEGRHPEFHSARDRIAVPRRKRSAAILFPQRDPWKIAAAPGVTAQHLTLRMPGEEERRVVLLIHEVSRHAGRMFESREDT